MPATLYIVATPIGNLADMTFRAVRILGEVNLIAAEDTRRSLKLLNHFGISKPLTSYFDHNKEFKGELILDVLRQGKSVALISDAGTPCISDPGRHLVRDALAEGITVTPVPGACAAIAAFSASGLPYDTFAFAGFPPTRQVKRREFLTNTARLSGVLLLYEAPHRLENCLRDILDIMGDRQIVVARELTKIYEEFIRGSVSQVIAAIAVGKIRGEVVILIAPGEAIRETSEPWENILKKLLYENGLSVRDAAREVAEQLGVSRSEAYVAALRFKTPARPD